MYILEPEKRITESTTYVLQTTASNQKISFLV